MTAGRPSTSSSTSWKSPTEPPNLEHVLVDVEAYVAEADEWNERVRRLVELGETVEPEG